MRFKESPPEMAERAAIGAMLLNIDDTIECAIEAFGDMGGCFIDERLDWIYLAIINLHKDGDPVDLVTVCHQLSEIGKLAAFGGAVEVAALTDYVPTSANFPWYAAIVKHDHIRRQLLQACGDTGNSIRESGAGTQDAMRQLEERLYSMESQTSHGRIESIGEILPRVFARIHEVKENPDRFLGITTGMPSVDTILDKLRPETLNILAARPSVGKSAVAVNIAMSAAKSGHPVLFFSLEMGRESIVRRFLSVEANLPWKKLSFGYELNAASSPMVKAGRELAISPIRIIDSERIDMFRLRAGARRFAATHDKMPLVIIDYLQLCVRGGKTDTKRHEAVGDFTRECKALARELRCPFLLLSQLSREADGIDNPFKGLHCLKDSGNIEEDADTVMIATKEAPDHVVAVAAKKGVEAMNLINFGVVKNREGEVKLCPLYFNKESQKVVALADYDPYGRNYEPDDEPIENTYDEDDHGPF